MDYDCTNDVTNHKKAVRHFISVIVMKLGDRLRTHDDSKLQQPEKEMFDEFVPKLKELEYGSDEYKAALKEMGGALRHHYDNNSHHPEHFENGIDGMSLLDLVEMFCDWQAAWLKNGKGEFADTIEINKKRFGMSDQLYSIFINTVNEVW